MGQDKAIASVSHRIIFDAYLESLEVGVSPVSEKCIHDIRVSVLVSQGKGGMAVLET